MKYFNSDMTSQEARTVLFRVAENMTPSQREDLIKEYRSVAPVIMEREFKTQRELRENCWLTADTL